jgi:phosphotriesterase-related protein
MGAWISLDNIAHEHINDYLTYLEELKTAGHLDRVLISHDAGWYSAGQKDGGSFRGYATIFREFIPLLEENGFTEAEINRLLVENPAKAFMIRDESIKPNHMETSLTFNHH